MGNLLYGDESFKKEGLPLVRYARRTETTNVN